MCGFALREYINDYLTDMSAIIRSRHKGALDKSIGDAIMALNAASRLEGLTQRYGVGILVGEATRQRVQEATFREVDRVVCEPFAQMLRAYRWLI